METAKGHGLACTVAWTQLAQAMRADGMSVGDTCPPHISAFIREMVSAALASDTGGRGVVGLVAKWNTDANGYDAIGCVGLASIKRDCAEQLRAALRAQPAGGGAMLTNPHTGTPRDYRDVETDPAGILIHKTGEPLLATATPEAGVQREGGLTRKQAWWAGARAGLGVPADMPRTEVAALLTQPQPASGDVRGLVDEAMVKLACRKYYNSGEKVYPPNFEAMRKALEAALARQPAPDKVQQAAVPESGSVYLMLRSIRYNASHGSQDRPAHKRLHLIAVEADKAIAVIEAAMLQASRKGVG